MTGQKVKMSFTIDRGILDEAKKASEDKNIPLSRAVENFLKFFSNPWVYCFKCGAKFQVKSAELCPKCGWLKCPECSACGCELSEETRSAVFYMRRVYEDLLIGRLK